MREQFEEHRRHFRRAGFEVALVPHAAACPVGLECGTYVVDDSAEHQVGEVAGGHAARPVAESFTCGGVDAQRTDDGVVHCGAGIAVESETEIDGDIKSLAAGEHRGASGEPVHPQAAAAVVVVVVVHVVCRRVHAVGSAGILQEIAGAFHKAGISAGCVLVVDAVERHLHYTFHMAHATADFHGVGTHGTAPVGASVVELDHGLHACFQREVAEVDPCSAAHALVHGDFVAAVGGVHGIVRFGGAVGECFVAHIHGIVSCLGNVGAPCGFRVGVVVAGKRTFTGRTFGERILVVAQGGSFCAESASGIAPAAVFGICAGGVHAVVVDNNLCQIGVALAGTHHIGSGIFEHRHQEGHHVTLRVKVFDGLENTGALPFPAVEFRFEIPSVALPEGDVGAIEPFGCGIGAGAPYERGVFRGAAVHFFGEQHKVVEVAACCGEHNIVAREPVGFGYLFFQIFQCCGCERNVSGGFVQVDSDSACGIVDSKAFGFDIGKVSLAGQAGLYLADCL